MPTRAGSACTRQGCPGIVRGAVCSVCGPRRKEYRQQEDAQRGTPTERGYDARWQRVREIKIARNPVCEECAAQGVTTVADDVHHIVPIRVDPSRRLDISNLRSLCRRHHAAAEREARAVV